ncbi:MAG: CoA ester lyase [Desulfobacterales bacterium]|jgi:citrate lyase subunit beta/citryl-CoA lyase|nr:CoA ester lyase [Desulfobacterales bacterium]MDH3826299.1 CoA ester lyase [Desulfobacterales bacterium]MDH3877228.1 CoA ester lyase [Desulfobacterales bacterium]
MKLETDKLGPIRSALFVPGNRPDRVDKAVATVADRVIIDLEDAVAVSQKVETRALVRDKIIVHKDRRVLARVNGLETDFIMGDLSAIVVNELGGLVLPKTENSHQVGDIHRLLVDLEKKQGLAAGNTAVILLVESALGVQNIFQISSAATELNREFLIALGAADYALDMGIEITKDGRELMYPRSRIAVACRAAGIAPPLDTPFMIDLKDIEALKEDAARAKQLGFQGKLCIHPNQIEPVHVIFTPTAEEISFARRVVDAFVAEEAGGSAAILVDGKFVDYPVVERSRRILQLASIIDGI